MEVDHKNLDGVIPDFQEDKARLHELADMGFAVALDIHWNGPLYSHNEYPEVWARLYFDKNFFVLDPLFYWTVVKSGQIRWSEVKLPDPRGVLKKAAEHGLRYGCTFSQKESDRRHLLSLARSDRELTDEEMAEGQAIFDKWVAASVAKRTNPINN